MRNGIAFCALFYGCFEADLLVCDLRFMVGKNWIWSFIGIIDI
uniref:Uncharacterized protein n=1 Tax=Rhizophora mucronata TaxID=61149 RepID=A0A2P2N970_RHIMU